MVISPTKTARKISAKQAFPQIQLEDFTKYK